MNHWARRMIIAAAPLLLTGCLWGPGKFSSDLTVRNDGSFTLEYRGEIVMQMPPDARAPVPWDPDSVRCHRSGRVESGPSVQIIQAPGNSGAEPAEAADPLRPCTAAEVAKAKADHEKQQSARASAKSDSSEDMARAFGLTGFDDDSNRAFAAKLSKQAGWRSVTYRGNGVFDVEYHMEGSARQDFLFPALPESDLLIPFIAIRPRKDGSVLVTAPALTGGAGPLAARAGSAASEMKGSAPSRAEGRLTIVTDGEILTNNSEDGPSAHALGRSLHWDVAATSKKIPETLIRLR